MKVVSRHNPVQNKKTTNHSGNQKASTNFGNGAAIMGSLSKGLQFLDANPMAGVTFLDVSTAIGPNTVIDAKERNPIQAFETFRRESSGLLINCLLPGAAAAGVGYLVKNKTIGSEFKDVGAHQIWANKETIDEATHTWKNLKGSTKKEKVAEFVDNSLNKVLSNKDSVVGKNNHEKLAPVKKKLTKAIIDAEEGKLKISREVMNEVHDDLAKIYGDSKSIRVKGSNGKEFKTGLKSYIRDTFSLSKAFSHEKINSGNIDKFAKGVKKTLGNKSAITMVGIGALALAMQKINRKITEKVSGKKGYQGYSDNTKYVKLTDEEKGKLNKKKLLSVGWYAGLALAAMGKPTAGMLNFTSPTTSMNQARTFALLTNSGRVAAAEDKNELKDSRLRDTMIFLNLYVLGDYVQKGVASVAEKIYKKKHGVDLNLMNKGEKLDKNASVFKKAGNWLRGKSVKSFEEIEGTASKASVKLRKNIVTAANVSGIAYSLLALGVIMPVAIARMTQKNRSKQLEQLKLQGRSYDSNIAMTGGFSNEKTQKLFKAFKS